MKNKYIADILGSDFEKYDGQKVILTAPTGAGKTTFIVRNVIPYYENKKSRFHGNKKVLILVNRKLLKKQIESKLFQAAREKHIKYDSWEIMTYQELEAKIKLSSDLTGFASKYSAVIADEAHYFYHDAAFNEMTMQTLYVLLYASYALTVIFMSATTEKIIPFIKEAWRRVFSNHERINGCKPGFPLLISQNINGEVNIVDGRIEKKYSKFIPYVVDSLEDLACCMCSSDSKWLVFINNKSDERQLMDLLIKEGAEKSEIVVIHSENMDLTHNVETIEKLTSINKLNVKYMISTSVMDNGVSIEDFELRNVCIITTSKLSFVQMLGRVRECKGAGRIKLVFVRQKKEDYSTMLAESERIVKAMDNFLENTKGGNFMQYKISMKIEDELVHGADDLSKALKKIMMLCPKDPVYFDTREMHYDIYPIGVKYCYVINRIAVERLRDSYREVKAVYDILAGGNGSNELIKYQLSWIGLENKAPKAIVTDASNDFIDEMKAELLRINNYSKEDLQVIKTELVRKYFKKLYPEYSFRGGNNACSTNRLKEIVEKNGLVFKQETVSEHVRYFVLEPTVKCDNTSLD